MRWPSLVIRCSQWRDLLDGAVSGRLSNSPARQSAPFERLIMDIKAEFQSIMATMNVAGMKPSEIMEHMMRACTLGVKVAEEGAEVPPDVFDGLSDDARKFLVVSAMSMIGLTAQGALKQ